MEDFDFALRVARERRGLMQMEGMRQTGIHNKTLSGYENGFSSRIFPLSADSRGIGFARPLPHFL